MAFDIDIISPSSLLTEPSAKLIVHLATDSMTSFGRIELTQYRSSMNDKRHSRGS